LWIAAHGKIDVPVGKASLQAKFLNRMKGHAAAGIDCYVNGEWAKDVDEP
jgi:hypothetical protein